MFPDDTIAAISTPLGEGGIGIVRISGKDAITIADRIFSSPKDRPLHSTNSYRIVYGHISDHSTETKIDEVLVTVMRAPHSYTREDVVEINCHGGMVALSNTLDLVLQKGARLAEPGEFTKRAFLNGRIDLTQAEAVLDLIRSKTDESMRIAMEQLQGGLSEKVTEIRDRVTDICAHIEAYIDFPEDEIEPASKNDLLTSMGEILKELQSLLITYDEGKFFREGLLTAIVGRPNVGKSSLLNALLRKDRAIVTDIPGTTRDVIEEYLNIDGLPLRIMDTAGIRDGENIVEKEGVRRSLKSIKHADLVIAIFDWSESLKDEDFEVIEKIKDKNVIVTLNKNDLPNAFQQEALQECIPYYKNKILSISATKGDGLNTLKKQIVTSCLKNWKEAKEGVVVANIRHKIGIEKAREATEKAVYALTEEQPLEILALELRDALASLGEIVGVVTTEDILNKIFSEFCIGK
jgi:tRNA modification GTPase